MIDLTYSTLRSVMDDIWDLEISPKTKSVTVGLRTITIPQKITPSIFSCALQISRGVYSDTKYGQELSKCLTQKIFGETFNKPQILYDLTFRAVAGPSYWSNSCNIDSILAIVAYTSGPSWRIFMQIEKPTKEREAIIDEIKLPIGVCETTRRQLLILQPALKPNVWVMRSAGEMYDLLSDYFPLFKIPVLKFHSNGISTTFHSSISTFDFVSGTEDIAWNRLNYSHLVFEDNLEYQNPCNMIQEPHRPPKKALISEKILNERYGLCAIVYLLGVRRTQGESLLDIFKTENLGVHYYTKIKLMDQKWYYYDDTSKNGQILLTSNNGALGKIHEDNGASAQLYFYERLTTLDPENIVVNDSKTMTFPHSFLREVKRGYILKQTYINEKVKVTFDSVKHRTKFEKIVRNMNPEKY
jgi:hypothetical protein